MPTGIEKLKKKKIRDGDPTEMPLKYFPAGGPVLHAVWGNQGIISTTLTHGQSVSTQDPG